MSAFRRDGNGDLVTVDGFKLVPPISLPQEATAMVVGLDGTVQVKLPGSDTLQDNGQISLYRFPNPAGLRAEGGNFFRITASSGAEVQQVPGQTGAGFIRQGFLERSNTSVVDELIALIQAQRNYEVNSRTIQVSDEMLQQVSQLI